MLFTLEELASHLQQDLDTASAQLAHDNALGAITAATGQTVDQVLDDQITLIVDRRDYWLSLPQRPVTAVTSVKIGGVEVAGWTWDGNTKIYMPSAVGWPILAVFAPPTRQVTVTYSHGWADGAKPFWLRQLGFRLAARFYDNPTEAEQERIDDYSRTLASLQVEDQSALHRLGRSGAFSVGSRATT